MEQIVMVPYGVVITNAGYNNPNVTGLVYVAAHAPDENETINDFFEQVPEENLKEFTENTELDSAGFLYVKPDKVYVGRFVKCLKIGGLFYSIFTLGAITKLSFNETCTVSSCHLSFNTVIGTMPLTINSTFELNW
jgi:hypothetical protein